MTNIESATEIVSDPVGFVQRQRRLDSDQVEALKALAFLKDAPVQVVAELLLRVSTDTFRLNDEVLTGTSRIDKIYIVTHGYVRVLQGSGHGLVTHVAAAGQSFGLVGITPAPRGVSVMEAVTISSAKIFVLKGNDLLQVMDMFPPMWSSDRLSLVWRVLPKPRNPTSSAG